jgi:hypothetical protein
MPHDGAPASRWWQARIRPHGALIAAAAMPLIVTAALLLCMQPSFSTDVAWQFWVAHRLRDGARFYVDIMETNPPLWFWMAIPIDAAAGAIGIAPERMLVAALGTATMLSLVATTRLLDPLPPRRRIALLGFAAMMLLVMPLGDTGQREQYALIAALPYVALAAARRRSRAVDARLALAIGIGGAFGFALKHYFLGVPVLLELWLLFRRDRPLRLRLRPELAGLLAVAILYVCALLIVAPDYLLRVVPDLRLAYGAAAPRPLMQMIQLTQYLWGLALLMLLPALALIGRGKAPLTTALLIAATGFGAAWLIQHKGWPYHAIATTGFVSLALVALLIEAWESLPAPIRLLGPAAAILPIALPFIPGNPPLGGLDVGPMLRDLHRGDSIAIVSTENAFAWPVVWDRGFRYPSRYNAYWMLWAIDRAGGRSPALDALGRRIVAETVQDYLCLPPRRIIFVRPQIDASGPNAAGDPLTYFDRDPGFTRLLGQYRKTMQSGIFEAWDRTGTPGPRPALCRRGT